jgi:Glycosyltransferase
LGLNLEQTSVIYHGCSFHQVAASSEMHAVPRPYILYVGSRGGRYKNFDALLAAFGESSLKGSFDLVAFGGGAFTVSELGKIRKVGISDAIRHVTGDDCLLAGYYRNATAFVYPSRYEGFGFPPLEAMASNCPVICSTAKSVVEIVGEAAAYFDPNDINGLRDSLERVAGDAQFAADLRARGSARVKEYSWQKCAEQTLSVYRQLS